MLSTDITSLNYVNSLPILTELPSKSSIEKNIFRPRLLIVEDNIINQKVASVYLDEWGYRELDITSTGHRALDLSKINRYSLIILDIGLPDISGIEVCKSIRNSFPNASTPVIAVTAHFDEVIRQKCLDAGCNSVFCKPVEFNLLHKNIVTLLEANNQISQ